MNKQIEEMANLICEMAGKPKSCMECRGRNGGCFTIPKMKILYSEGYRKQNEGEWIFNRGRTYGESSYYCSLCSEGASEYGYDKFCPNCGAKMKGESK